MIITRIAYLITIRGTIDEGQLTTHNESHHTVLVRVKKVESKKTES